MIKGTKAGAWSRTKRKDTRWLSSRLRFSYSPEHLPQDGTNQRALGCLTAINNQENGPTDMSTGQFERDNCQWRFSLPCILTCIFNTVIPPRVAILLPKAIDYVTKIQVPNMGNPPVELLVKGIQRLQKQYCHCIWLPPRDTERKTILLKMPWMLNGGLEEINWIWPRTSSLRL